MLLPCNFLAIVFTSAITCFETSLAATAFTTLVISLLNGLKTNSLALTAFVHGGKLRLTFANALTASVRFVFNAGNWMLAFDGL